MKSLTFDEFFALPPGTIFGQATGLPHQFSTGLYRKGTSWDAHDEDGEHDDPSIEIQDVLFNEDGGHWREELIYPGMLEDDHRFLVYEARDLDRLTQLIGRSKP